MIITPEAVERALRSWANDDLASAWTVAYEDDVLWGPPDEAIVALARHVAAVLSTEPARFEVSEPVTVFAQGFNGH